MAGSPLSSATSSVIPIAPRWARLAFSELTVTGLSPDATIVFGHWQLTRAADSPHGLFTLLVGRTFAGWRIFADYPSAANP